MDPLEVQASIALVRAPSLIAEAMVNKHKFRNMVGAVQRADRASLNISPNTHPLGTKLLITLGELGGVTIDQANMAATYIAAILEDCESEGVKGPFANRIRRIETTIGLIGVVAGSGLGLLATPFVAIIGAAVGYVVPRFIMERVRHTKWARTVYVGLGTTVTLETKPKGQRTYQFGPQTSAKALSLPSLR